MTSVMLVEDDAEIRRSLTAGLGDLDYQVLCFADGGSALTRGLAAEPDIVLLDLGLPDIDGATLLSMMRSVSAIPVIVVTARVAGEDVVRLLNLGADDYITKPFSLSQLDARIRAVLRRTTPAAPALLRVGDLTIDPSKRQVSLDGELVELRNTEYRLLVLLAENPGRVIPLAEITGHLWNSNSPEALARLDVQVSSLRGKLGETGRRPGYLRRIRGVGIALTPLQH